MPLNGGEVAPGGGGHVEGGTERGLGPSRAAAEARQAVRHTNAFLNLENGCPRLDDLRTVAVSGNLLWEL